MTTLAGPASAAYYAKHKDYYVAYNARRRERQRAYNLNYHVAHLEESKVKVRAWAAAHPGHNTRLVRAKHGWSIERFDEYLNAQESCCAICGRAFESRRKEPHADHDHSDNSPRGLLCSNCNVGIGHFQEDPELLRLAVEYLSEWKRA